MHTEFIYEKISLIYAKKKEILPEFNKNKENCVHLIKNFLTLFICLLELLVYALTHN